MSRANSAYQLLGLARRAGVVTHGTEAVREAVRSGEAKIVLLAGDASPVQLDKVRRTLAGRPVPNASLGDRADLGAAIGMDPVSAIAITDVSLADRISAELGLAEPVAAALEAAVEAGQDR